jgi:hypothetical protein
LGSDFDDLSISLLMSFVLKQSHKVQWVICGAEKP